MPPTAITAPRNTCGAACTMGTSAMTGTSNTTTAYAATPTALQIRRYPATKSAASCRHASACCRVYCAYTSTTGATEGNIIAAIITTQVATKIAKLAKSVPEDIAIEPRSVTM